MSKSTPYELTGRTRRSRARARRCWRRPANCSPRASPPRSRRPRSAPRSRAPPPIATSPTSARSCSRATPGSTRSRCSTPMRRPTLPRASSSSPRPSGASSSNASPSCARCCACRSRRRRHTDDALPLRTGRAIGWIEDALAPLRDELPAPELRRLVLAIRATLGIEPLVWLCDIARTPARGRGRPHALLRSHAVARGHGRRGARALRLRLGHPVAPQDVDRARRST